MTFWSVQWAVRDFSKKTTVSHSLTIVIWLNQVQKKSPGYLNEVTAILFSTNTPVYANKALESL